MRYRSTLVYLAATIVLVALYLHESRTEKKKEEASQEASKFFQVNPGGIEGVTIKKGNTSIHLEKRALEGRPVWEITSPVRTGTEKTAVANLVDRLAGLKHSRLISEGEENLSPFGLDKPEMTLSFRVAEKEDSVSFGARSPLGDGFYARRGEGRKIYLVTVNDKMDVDKSLTDLRNKALFTLDPEKVTRLAIQRESGSWTLDRKEGRWVLQGDDAFPLDQETVGSIVRSTLLSYAVSFEKEKAEHLNAFGLDRPQARVSLSDGKKTEQILYGRSFDAGKETRTYAMLAGKPPVVTVRSRFVEDLPRSADELREKESEKHEKGGTS